MAKKQDSNGCMGMCVATCFALGLDQAELAECPGLTPIHVNRVSRKLRASRIW